MADSFDLFRFYANISHKEDLWHIEFDPEKSMLFHNPLKEGYLDLSSSAEILSYGFVAEVPYQKLSDLIAPFLPSSFIPYLTPPTHGGGSIAMDISDQKMSMKGEEIFLFDRWVNQISFPGR